LPGAPSAVEEKAVRIFAVNFLVKRPGRNAGPAFKNKRNGETGLVKGTGFF
jgi:hypothetical protein